MRPTATPHAEPTVSRRAFLVRAAAGAAGLAVVPPVRAQGDGKPPVTGAASPDLEPFDRLMTSFIQDHQVPGAALAVTRNGRLVYARGFGYADVEKKEPVRPAALFRIASVSKPLTAVAVLRLAARGKLKLDDKAADHVTLDPALPAGAKADPRWKRVTVRQCLQHTGGWDRDKSPDPIGRAWEAAKVLGIKPPVGPEHIVRYALGRPLDFDPGKRFAYANVGYLVLGRVIEAAAGKGYEDYVKAEVLGPLGVKRPRLGRALAEHRAKGEVRYYVRKDPTGRCLYPPRVGKPVPVQYGADNLEAFEAHGGWIASAVDLVRFAAAFDDPAKCPILDAKAIQDMWARPDGAAGQEPNGKPKEAYYGCGWNVRPIGTAGKSNTWHGGYIPGTESLLVRRFDGLNWAVLFNTDHTPGGESLAGLIDGRLHEAADAVKAWPDADQFGKFLK